MSHISVQFSNTLDNNFQKDLRKKVAEYFKVKGLSRHANKAMIFKTTVFIMGYFVPYTIMLTVPLPGIAYAIFTLMMSFSLAGIGMSIMHDANHGAYSSNKLVNKLLGYTMNLIGGNRFNWLIQHNVKHHTYTNIYGADEDLHTGGIIRFSHHAQWFWFHRFQHIYAWVLYSLGTFTWLTTKDFKQLTDCYNQKIIDKSVFAREIALMVLWKAFYYFYMVAVPIMLIDLPVSYIVIGFITMHLMAGFVLGLTFQLAHVVELTDQSSVLQEKFDDSWIAHQTRTTANFARSNAFLNWYLGGLNFQIEHHLFPHICHIHYKKLSPIVKNTILENGLPYHEHITLTDAISSHFRMLKSLGVKPEPHAKLIAV